MSQLKKLAGQTAIYGLSSIVGRFINYLLVPLYTSIFSPSEYGIITELYAYSSFLIIIFTYGLETAYFRFVQNEKDKEYVLGTSLFSILFSSLFFFISFGLFMPNIAQILGYENNTYLLWMVLIILITDALVAIPFARLRQQNKAWKFASLKIINILINISLNLLFLVWIPYLIHHGRFIGSWYSANWGVGYVFLSNLIANIVTLILLLPTYKIQHGFNFELWKRMMNYSIPLLFAGLAGMVNETFDRAMLKYLLTNKNDAMRQLGIYGANYKISILMTLFIQTFRFAAEPFFFNHSKEENAKQTYAIIMKYFIIFGLFIFLLVMLNLHFVQYFIGKEFREGLKVVPILLLANLFLGIFFNLSIWYKLTNKTNYGAYLAFFGATITILLNILLIPKMGYLGAAWATLICYTSMTIMSYIWSNRFYKINYPLKDIALYFILALFLYAISTLHKIESYGWLTLVNGIIILVFITIVYIKEKNKIKNLNI
ncbi:MAG: oligosaccharide flippase family protein [Bacteroidales bacterium]|nr:oligosaccharide flippase family protein [Bacteroidales bacterium]